MLAIRNECSQTNQSRARKSMKIVRGLFLATGQYSSFCGCAVGLMLGVLDIMGVEVQNREQVEVRENVGHERQRKKTKQGNNKRSVDEHVLCRHVVRHLEQQCDVCTRMKVSRKSFV